MDFAAEQAGQLAADGETEAGAAVLAAGRGIGLLEGLEDDLLLLRRNADAGVGHFEGHHRRRLAQHRVSGAPAAERRGDIEPDAALSGEFEGVRQQVLEHLLQLGDAWLIITVRKEGVLLLAILTVTANQTKANLQKGLE